MLQSGGSLYEAASFTNGSSNNPLSSLPGIGFSSTLDQVQGGGMSTGGPMNVTLKIDGDATTQLMRGEAIQVIASPAGQRASLSGVQASNSRLQTAAALTSPLTKY